MDRRSRFHRHLEGRRCLSVWGSKWCFSSVSHTYLTPDPWSLTLTCQTHVGPKHIFGKTRHAWCSHLETVKRTASSQNTTAGIKVRSSASQTSVPLAANEKNWISPWCLGYFSRCHEHGSLDRTLEASAACLHREEDRWSGSRRDTLAPDSNNRWASYSVFFF